MANDFFKNGDKAYSENLNDGLLVGNAFDWTVDISLPDDSGSVFPNSSTVVKAKVADVSITPNSNLSIGSTIENNSSSSQVYRLTVYPNFNRFGGFVSISLVADSGVTFYIANKGGTSPIASNLDYDDLGNVPELKVLKEYDIVITIPRNKEVTGLEFVFQSSSADVSGSISQSNVTGLSDSLTTLNTQVAGLINANDEIWNYDLSVSDYNPTVDSTVTVTCRVTDFYGEAVAGESVTLYCNGSSVSTSITNNQGIATWTVTVDTLGLNSFSVANSKLAINVKDKWKILVNDGVYNIRTKDNVVRFSLALNTTTSFPTSWTAFGGTHIPEGYGPAGSIIMFNSANPNVLCAVRTDGTVDRKTLDSTSYSGYGYFFAEWTI